MNKDCDNKVNECLPCNDYPIVNLSAEEPDSSQFLGSVVFLKDPGIGEVWQADGCLGWATSTVSVDDAILQAAQQDCPDDAPPLPPPPAPEPDPDPDPGPGPDPVPPCDFPRCEHPEDSLCPERPRLEVVFNGLVVWCDAEFPGPGNGYCQWATTPSGGCPSTTGFLYAFNNVDPINFDMWIARVNILACDATNDRWCAAAPWQADGRPPEAIYVLSDAWNACQVGGFNIDASYTPIAVTLEVPPP